MADRCDECSAVLKESEKKFGLCAKCFKKLGNTLFSFFSRFLKRSK